MPRFQSYNCTFIWMDFQNIAVRNKSDVKHYFKYKLENAMRINHYMKKQIKQNKFREKACFNENKKKNVAHANKKTII